MAIPPLDPLITFEEVQHAEKPFHRSETVGELLQTLFGMGAFLENTSKTLASSMYELRKKNSASDLDWGAQRIDRLKRGRGSAILREAQYFHDGFSHVFSADWGRRVELKQLITRPIGQIIEDLQRSAPVELTDPVKLTFMLNAVSQNKPMIFELTPDDFRWGKHTEMAEDPAPVDDIPTLSPLSHFQLRLRLTSATQNYLVLQIADEPVLVDGRAVRAQLVDHLRREGDTLVVGSYQGDLIEVSPIHGRFHYLAISSSDVPRPLPPMLEEMELTQLLNDFWQRKLAGENIITALTSYRVS